MSLHKILDIVEGRKTPTASNKFGRPPKEFHADVFGVRPQYNMVSAFNQEAQTFDYSIFKGGVVTGYLEQNNNSFLLNVLVDGKVLTHFVPYEISNKYDLRAGDQLCVTLVKRGANMVIEGLELINGIEVNRFNNLRPDFSTMRHIDRVNHLVNYRGKLTVDAGDIVYLKGLVNVTNSLTLVDIMNSSTKTKNVYINISLLDKTKGLVERLNNATNFTTSLTDDEDYILKVLKTAYEHIQRLVESGYQVLVGVDDMVSMDRLVDGIKFSKMLLALAKNTECGSVSLIGIMPSDNTMSVYDKLSDKVYWVE